MKATNQDKTISLNNGRTFCFDFDEASELIKKLSGVNQELNPTLASGRSFSFDKDEALDLLSKLRKAFQIKCLQEKPQIKVAAEKLRDAMQKTGVTAKEFSKAMTPIGQTLYCASADKTCVVNTAGMTMLVNPLCASVSASQVLDRYPFFEVSQTSPGTTNPKNSNTVNINGNIGVANFGEIKLDSKAKDFAKAVTSKRHVSYALDYQAEREFDIEAWIMDGIDEFRKLFGCCPKELHLSNALGVKLVCKLKTDSYGLGMTQKASPRVFLPDLLFGLKVVEINELTNPFPTNEMHIIGFAGDSSHTKCKVIIRCPDF